jgi:hypothetical protein
MNLPALLPPPPELLASPVMSTQRHVLTRKRDVVVLSLDEWVGAAAAGVVGVPVPEGVRIDADRGVPLVGKVAMVDFSLVERQNPNSVETGEGGVGKMRNRV